MPLVNMKPVLVEAKAQGYAVAAFNLVDYASTKGMIAAAEELNAPVICQTSAKTIKYYGHKTIVNWVRELATDSPVPVVLHLDHCKDLDMIRKCAESGWTSIMIDASDQPFEKNLELSKQVSDIGAKYGVGVEAEIGQILGVEDDMVVTAEESHLTKPDEAERFCKALDLAAFAAAIGTAHGYYKGEPKVEFDLIKEINTRTGVPMALHGGTGLNKDTISRCISLGCAKINISTNLKHIFVESFVKYHEDNPKDYEPLRVIDAQYQAMKALFKDKIAEFGGANRGAEMLSKVA